MDNIELAREEMKESEECYRCMKCVYRTENDNFTNNGKLPCGQYRCWHSCAIAQKYNVSIFDCEQHCSRFINNLFTPS